MRGDVSVVVLGVLHEAIAVEPIVEDQNVVAWREKDISSSQLRSADLVTDLLRGAMVREGEGGR